jgi:hypothetical protein
MKRSFLATCLPVLALLSTQAAAQAQKAFKVIAGTGAEKISVYRPGIATPLLTQNAGATFRPYIHPITTPDGKGELTQFSPGHHRHQTGLYWGLTRVNGRDYFHHPGEGYWKRISARIEKGEGQQVAWSTVYDMLGKDGSPILTETQKWTMSDSGKGHIILDLEWQGAARDNVTVSKYNYGGLFLRMPWKRGIRAQALNASGLLNQKGEGKRSKWVDLGMQIEGLSEDGHIAIFDHPENDGFPNPWRIDGQFGIGPSHARLGNWFIEKGKVKTFRHRFIIYKGNADAKILNQQWNEWAPVKGEASPAQGEKK